MKFDWTKFSILIVTLFGAGGYWQTSGLASRYPEFTLWAGLVIASLTFLFQPKKVD